MFCRIFSDLFLLNSITLKMEQYIASSNSALELKLGIYSLYTFSLLPFCEHTIFIAKIVHFFILVRKVSDILDSKVAFYPDMTYQVFGNM